MKEEEVREKVKSYPELRNANDVWELKLIVGRDRAQASAAQ